MGLALSKVSTGGKKSFTLVLRYKISDIQFDLMHINKPKPS